MNRKTAAPRKGEFPSAIRDLPATDSSSTVRNIFSIRGTTEWREWLDRFAAHQRVTPTALIDRALAEAARRAGFDEPPPRY